MHASQDMAATALVCELGGCCWPLCANDEPDKPLTSDVNFGHEGRVRDIGQTLYLPPSFCRSDI